MLYELLTGLPPWYDENANTMVKRILSTPLALPEYLTPQARELLSLLLSRDPLKRPSSSEIRRHSFFGKVDWSTMNSLEVRPPIQPCESVDAIVRAMFVANPPNVCEPHFLVFYLPRRAPATSALSSRANPSET